MPQKMVLRIWDVEHGACAMLHHVRDGVTGRLAMIDSGDTPDWRPSTFIRHALGRTTLDYLFITNADQDHISDLQGLWDAGISVTTWHRNPTLGALAYQMIKQQGGPLTKDAQRYMQNLTEMVGPVPQPFNDWMGGIAASMFYNTYPTFQKTNDLSLVVFISYGPFKIAFPGDLEVPGWQALLVNPAFQWELTGTTVLIASHHGRDNGYCPEIFDYCRPQVVVMSDKAIVHDTQQMGQTYRGHVIRHWPNGVYISNTKTRRQVLTTRNDGHITFEVNDQGGYDVHTENQG